MKCHICETKIDEKYDYCRICAWEIEYYFDKLSEKEKKRYESRLRIWKDKFNHKNKSKSVNDQEVKVGTKKIRRLLISVIWGIFSILSMSIDIDFLTRNEEGLIIGSISLSIWFLIFYKQNKNVYEIERFINWFFLFIFCSMEVSSYIQNIKEVLVGMVMSIFIIYFYSKGTRQ